MSVEAPERPSATTKNWVAGLPSITAPADDATPPGPSPDASGQPPGNTPPPPDPNPKPDVKAGKPGEKPPEKPGESEDRWPRTAQEWKEFRQARDAKVAERDARIKELEENLAKASSAAAPVLDAKELESLKQERDQLSQRLQVIAVERHPKFEAYFKNKTDAQLQLAKNIVGAENAEAIEKALSIQDPELRTERIESLLADLPRSAQWQMGGIMNSLEQIRMERQAEIARAGESYKELVEKDQKSAAERRSMLEKTFDSAVAKAQSKEDGLPMFQFRDGDDAWNADVKKRIDTARAILLGQHANPEHLVTAALNAMAYQPLINALKHSSSELAKLQAQVSALTKAQPGIDPGRPEGAEAGAHSESPKPGMRPNEVAASWQKGLPKLGG